MRARVRAAAAALITLLCLLALPATGDAQAPAATLTISQVDASAYPDIVAVATVLDANGVPISVLGPGDFQASDGITTLPITGVERAQDSTLPLSVVITIDVSGSMAGEPLARAKQAATEFVASLGPDDQATIFAFNATVTNIVGFTKDHAALDRAIAALQAGGDTALFEATQTSVYAARIAPASRKAVVMLTDGANDAPDSDATADGSRDTARTAGVPVFTIGFGDQPDAAYLESVSSLTLGQYRAADAGSVASVYAQIAQLLRSQYVIRMRAPGAADGKTGTLRITADVAGIGATATRDYTRGAAPAPGQPPATRGGGTSGSGAQGGKTALYALAGIVALAVVTLLALGASRWWRRMRIRRHQLEVVAPNPAQAARQPIPRNVTALRAPEESAPAAGTGRLIERTATGTGAEYPLGGGPVVIGSGRNCTIPLPAGDDVALEHARIWLRDGRYLLHSTAGIGRKTLVGGRDADWVVLEPGDELQFGRYHFVFQDDAHPPKTPLRGQSPTGVR
ncbi:MAG TPA: VWA domain-containing protein [Dehalococcoidia bacterium]|nr:VWA domain-containing protein [Dehalococcoidia bacterium]